MSDALTPTECLLWVGVEVEGANKRSEIISLIIKLISKLFNKKN